jgi:hypothetical protein
MSDFDERRALALARYDQQLNWYEKHSTSAHQYYNLAQALAIILGAVAPVLILIDDVPEALQAAVPACAAIALGLNGLFRWRDNWLRFAHTAEALKSERTKFDTRATDEYALKRSEDEVLAHFVVTIEALAMSETMQWQQLLSENEPQGEGGV